MEKYKTKEHGDADARDEGHVPLCLFLVLVIRSVLLEQSVHVVGLPLCQNVCTNGVKLLDVHRDDGLQLLCLSLRDDRNSTG